MKTKSELALVIIILMVLVTSCSSSPSHPNCGFTLFLPEGWGEPKFTVYDWEDPAIGNISVIGPPENGIVLGATCLSVVGSNYLGSTFSQIIETITAEKSAEFPDLEGPINNKTSDGQSVVAFVYTDANDGSTYAAYIESPNPLIEYVLIEAHSYSNSPIVAWQSDIEHIVEGIIFQ